MRWVTFLALCLPVVFCLSAAGADKPLDDNRILALILTESRGGSGYTVVKPETTLRTSPEDVETTRKYLLESEMARRPGVPELIDLLLKRNEKPVRLTLPSSTKDGYLVDYDGKFARYFEDDNGGGWDKWHEEHPDARGYTDVSLPAYDAKTGLILIYMGTQRDWEVGRGGYILFEYKKGKVKKIDEIMAWIS